MLRMKRPALFCLLLSLAACGQPDAPYTGVKVGKPYEVNGKTYYPSQEPDYDKTGDGSWYGPGFHGKRTASGERFNENDITAAHPTLPMPSLVRVTNLKNGKSIIVRVNDRGPFHRNRIIDLSKRSAQLIGLHSTMPVRVQYLKRETEAYIAELEKGGPLKIDMVAYNERAKAGGGFVSDAAAEEEEAPQAIAVSENVETVAPFVSVESNDLTPSTANAAAPAKATAALASKVVTLKPWADDNITLPEPPPYEEAQAPAPKPEKTLATPKKQEAKPAAATGGSYIILAGSYSSQANARTLAEKLSGHKIHASVDKVEAGGKNWWRVHAGPFADKQSAELALTKVQALGAPDARVAKK